MTYNSTVLLYTGCLPIVFCQLPNSASGYEFWNITMKRWLGFKKLWIRDEVYHCHWTVYACYIITVEV